MTCFSPVSSSSSQMWVVHEVASYRMFSFGVNKTCPCCYLGLWSSCAKWSCTAVVALQFSCLVSHSNSMFVVLLQSMGWLHKLTQPQNHCLVPVASEFFFIQPLCKPPLSPCAYGLDLVSIVACCLGVRFMAPFWEWSWRGCHFNWTLAEGG